MSLTNDIDYLLQHVSFLIGKQSDQVLQEQLGIGLSQLRILRTLQASPQTKQRDIASSLGQTEASISRQVKLMLDQGLLHSTINPKNHREHITTLTSKGTRVSEAAHEVLAKYHKPTFATLNGKQQEQLHEILRTLHNGVCALDHPSQVQP
jgi:DNA-binding MarR family transcriptional regulator